MDRKGFLKRLGFSAGAAVTLPNMLIQKSLEVKTPEKPSPIEPTDIGLTVPDDFRNGDVIRWMNKKDEYEYGVLNQGKIYMLEDGDFVPATQIKKDSLQRISQLQGTDL